MIYTSGCVRGGRVTYLCQNPAKSRLRKAFGLVGGLFTSQ